MGSVYVDGPNLYQALGTNPIGHVDPAGLESTTVDINGPFYINPSVVKNLNHRDVNGNPLTDAGAYFSITETTRRDNSWGDYWWYSDRTHITNHIDAGGVIEQRQYYVLVKMWFSKDDRNAFPKFARENPELALELIRAALAVGVTKRAMDAIKANAGVTYHGLLLAALAPALVMGAGKAFEMLKSGAINLGQLSCRRCA